MTFTNAVCIAVVLYGILYILYRKGYVVYSLKIAWVHIGSMGYLADECEGFCKSCHGFSRKVFKIKDTGVYVFTLETEIEKGEVIAQVLDEKKEPILSFTNIGEERLDLSTQEKYYLQLRYKHYSGSYLFRWKKEEKV